MEREKEGVVEEGRSRAGGGDNKGGGMETCTGGTNRGAFEMLNRKRRGPGNLRREVSRLAVVVACHCSGLVGPCHSLAQGLCTPPWWLWPVTVCREFWLGTS